MTIGRKNISEFHLARSATYQIRVRGRLDERWSAWFEGMTVTATDGETIFTERIADQSALHGLLAKIRDLGLPLISVTQVECERRSFTAGRTPICMSTRSCATSAIR